MCVCACMCAQTCLLSTFRSGTTEQYNDKMHLLQSVSQLKRDASERQKAQKAAKKKEKDLKKKTGVLRLAVMRAAKAGVWVPSPPGEPTRRWSLTALFHFSHAADGTGCAGWRGRRKQLARWCRGSRIII